MEQVIHIFDVVANRLKKWSQKDNNDVLNFRAVYDISVADLLVQMRETDRADEKTALRTYNMHNPPSPVLDALNWPLFVPAVFNQEGDEQAVPWTAGSTVQAPIHLEGGQGFCQYLYRP